MTKDEIKNKILAKANLKTEVVATAPLWGVDVTIRQWTGVERESWQEWIRLHVDQKAKTLITARGMMGLVVYLSVIDSDSGEKIFDSARDALEAEGTGLELVFGKATTLNKIGGEVDKAKKDLEKPLGEDSLSEAPKEGVSV